MIFPKIIYQINVQIYKGLIFIVTFIYLIEILILLNLDLLLDYLVSLNKFY